MRISSMSEIFRHTGWISKWNFSTKQCRNHANLSVLIDRGEEHASISAIFESDS
jgi:hypothetical protein